MAVDSEALRINFMFTITLLSSFHITHGKCNPDELFRIIETIRPEIIFEELPADKFEDIYFWGYNPISLEAITIKRYLEQYPIIHFPVDTFPKTQAELSFDAQIICDASIEYQELSDQNLFKVKEYGYSFINSEECLNTLDKMRFIEETIVAEIAKDELQEEHNSEKRLHHNREDEMLANIYNLSTSHPYNKALFICGAEHRRPLIEKIKRYEIDSKLKLNWIFYGA